MSKRWTQEEVDYLHDKWGELSLNVLCRNLNRSRNSILIKVNRLGLGAYKDGDGVMTLCQLIDALGKKQSYSYTKSKFLKHGLPVIKAKIFKRNILKVDLEKFWKWATKHKDLIDWSVVEENILGIEPEWVKERRKIDFYNKSNFVNQWSQTEDELLKVCVAKKLGYREIAAKIDRTELAIRRRCYDLYLDYPQKAGVIRWTQEDVSLACELKRSGYSYKYIGEKLGRSAESVRGKLGEVLRKQSA
jgi:hypothetical protein